MLYGRKLDPQGPSSIGGAKVEVATRSTMILDDYAPPFIEGGGAVTTRPLGVMEGRCLGPGATDALVAATAARTSLASAERRALTRSSTQNLDQRLARLGIGTRNAEGPGFAIIDIPLQLHLSSLR
jgi:hypothetical protein